MERILNPTEDASLVEQLALGKKCAFKAIFEQYWESLFAYVYNRTHDIIDSEEVVQEVFVALWVNRERLDRDKGTLSAYLFCTTKHKMLHKMRSEKVRDKYAHDFLTFFRQRESNRAEENLFAEDLGQFIEDSLSGLPPKCRLVYRMSREEHISNQEIAEKLKISKKTVENHLTKALKHLRIRLAEYDMLFFLLLANCL